MDQSCTWRVARGALCALTCPSLSTRSGRAPQRFSRPPPAAACAPQPAGWGLGDLRTVAGDIFRMILPLPVLQGVRYGSGSARRHFQGFAGGPQSCAGPVSSVGICRPNLPGLIVAKISAKERLVQRIFAAPGALPCLNFRAWCSCWHPHGAGTADRSSYAACAASRLQGHPWCQFC